MEPRVSVNMILQSVSATFGVSVIDIRSRRHSEAASRARVAACLLGRELTEQSFPQIGRSIGYRDHTTILRAARRAEEMLTSDAEFRQRYDEAKAAIVWVAGSQFADLLADDNAIEIATRIIDHPNSAPVRVSTREIIAMAVRLVALEELAISNFELLNVIDRLAETPAGSDADAMRSDAAALIDSIATALGSLGYANASTPSVYQGATNA